jgi:hypothetical protein
MAGIPTQSLQDSKPSGTYDENKSLRLFLLLFSLGLMVVSLAIVIKTRGCHLSLQAPTPTG